MNKWYNSEILNVHHTKLGRFPRLCPLRKSEKSLMTSLPSPTHTRRICRRKISEVTLAMINHYSTVFLFPVYLLIFHQLPSCSTAVTSGYLSYLIFLTRDRRLSPEHDDVLRTSPTFLENWPINSGQDLDFLITLLSDSYQSVYQHG